jgi:hypothetical protein
VEATLFANKRHPFFNTIILRADDAAIRAGFQATISGIKEILQARIIIWKLSSHVFDGVSHTHIVA